MRAILVDDEQLALDFMERLLVKTGKIEIIGKYSNPIIAKENIMKKNVDVVFLDINLPEMNGIELAGQLLEKKPTINIVFVTAYDEYAVKAFELNALDYVVKPVRIDRLKKTINRIETNLLLNSDKIPSTESIRLNVCRNLSIETEKGKFETIPWRTAKIQELFLYLLHNREQLVRKSLLIDLLWPEFDPDKAYSQLYTAIYHIRKTLNQFPGHFEIKNTTEGYILYIKNVVLDIEQWKNKVLTVSKLDEKTIHIYKDAMSLYTGGYLKEYNYWWTESDQYRWGQLWLKTAYDMADFYRKQGNVDEAKRWFTRICKEQPEAEEAYFALMKIYASEDNQVFVHQQYQTLKDVLQKDLGVQPSIEITKWYNQWRKSVTIS